MKNNSNCTFPSTSLESIRLPQSDAEAAELEHALTNVPRAGREETARATESVREAALLLPDLEQTRRFLKTLDPSGIFTFQTFSDQKNKSNGTDPLAAWFHGTLDEHAAELIARNRLGAGVFVMVNEGDGQGRQNQNVIRVRAHFVDLDGAPLDPILSAGSPPHMVVESSHQKWHAYWLIDDTPLGDFKVRQQNLAAKFKGDPTVCDLARVLRLPGFYHRKTDTPFMTRFVEGTKR